MKLLGFLILIALASLTACGKDNTPEASKKKLTELSDKIIDGIEDTKKIEIPTITAQDAQKLPEWSKKNAPDLIQKIKKTRKELNDVVVPAVVESAKTFKKAADNSN